jgi:hypothetical protein
MSSPFPTVRGIASLLVAFGSLLILPVLRPALIVESGVGTFLAEPVGLGVWIVGGILLLACAAITLEAFRRGSSSDKICASVAAVLSLILAVQYFGLSSLKTKKSPNHPAAGKAGIASRLALEHHRPGLPEPGRSAGRPV